VVLQFQIEHSDVLTVGILGNISDSKSLAVVLISTEIGAQRRRYKRIATIEVKWGYNNKQKVPEVIFIE